MKVCLNDNVTVWLGTAGFGYDDWKGNFYPAGLSTSNRLAEYSKTLSCVELDVTFYRIPSPAMISRWKSQTPDNFLFCAKFPQTVTHGANVTSIYGSGSKSKLQYLTMDERIEEAKRFIEIMDGLGTRLGPLLLQFPYSFLPEHIDQLDAILSIIPTNFRISVEFRNRLWCNQDTYSFLRGRSIPFTQVDHPWMPKVDVTTGRFHYLRMLGDHKVLTEDFSQVKIDRSMELSHWSNLIGSYAKESNDTLDIFVFFNNHFSGHAPTTLLEMKRLLEPKT